MSGANSVLNGSTCYRVSIGRPITPKDRRRRALERAVPVDNGLAQVWQLLQQMGVKWPYPEQSATAQNLDNIWLC